MQERMDIPKYMSVTNPIHSHVSTGDTRKTYWTRMWFINVKIALVRLENIIISFMGDLQPRSFTNPFKTNILKQRIIAHCCRAQPLLSLAQLKTFFSVWLGRRRNSHEAPHPYGRFVIPEGTKKYTYCSPPSPFLPSSVAYLIMRLIDANVFLCEMEKMVGDG